MKRVLIWDAFEIKNIGGPPGYLYNLKQYLSIQPDPRIVFLSDIRCKNIKHTSILEQNDESESSFSKLKLQLRSFSVVSHLLDKIVILRRLISRLYDFGWRDFHRSLPDELMNLVLDDFDYIHFHLTFQAAQFIEYRNDYKGKIILTSHCPCSYTDEIIQSSGDKFYRYVRFLSLYNEYRTFRSVDYLMFPCEGAMEPYEKVPCLNRALRKSKIFYIPSAINDIKCDCRSRVILNSIGIPSDSFVICFFGRHNKIKGYDIIRDRCVPLLDKYPHLHVICGGIGDEIIPTHERWHELGFVSNVPDFLSACDIYICANRDTYFDLSILEVLRSSTSLILSDNGGNRFFRSLPDSERKGLHFFSIHTCGVIESIIDEMIKLKNNNETEFESEGRSNRLLYEKYFTYEKYVANYMNAIDSLS